jgi:hypothetical protein
LAKSYRVIGRQVKGNLAAVTESVNKAGALAFLSADGK